MKSSVKNIVIRARVTEEEKINYEYLASELGMTVSELIRDTLNRRFINKRMGGTYGLEDLRKPKPQTYQPGDILYSKSHHCSFTILEKKQNGYNVFLDGGDKKEFVTFEYIQEWCKRI